MYSGFAQPLPTAGGELEELDDLPVDHDLNRGPPLSRLRFVCAISGHAVRASVLLWASCGRQDDVLSQRRQLHRVWRHHHLHNNGCQLQQHQSRGHDRRSTAVIGVNGSHDGSNNILDETFD